MKPILFKLPPRTATEDALFAAYALIDRAWISFVKDGRTTLVRWEAKPGCEVDRPEDQFAWALRAESHLRRVRESGDPVRLEVLKRILLRMGTARQAAGRMQRGLSGSEKKRLESAVAAAERDAGKDPLEIKTPWSDLKKRGR